MYSLAAYAFDDQASETDRPGMNLAINGFHKRRIISAVFLFDTNKHTTLDIPSG